MWEKYLKRVRNKAIHGAEFQDQDDAKDLRFLEALKGQLWTFRPSALFGAKK